MTLTRRQRGFLPFLLGGLSVEKAARKAGIGVATARRWLADPDFAAALDTLLDRQIEDACQRIGLELAELGPDAVKTIKAILKDGKADTEVRLRAANSAIDRLTKIGQLRVALKAEGTQHEANR